MAVVAELLVGVEQRVGLVEVRLPPRRELAEEDGSLGKRPIPVEHRFLVELVARAEARTVRAGACRMVRGVGHGPSGGRLAHATEEQAHERSDVDGGSHGGASARAEWLLVHDDGGREVAELFYVWALVVRHLIAQEQGVGSLPLALALTGDGVEGQRALS
jgi:hypothetical protein